MRVRACAWERAVNAARAGRNPNRLGKVKATNVWEPELGVNGGTGKGVRVRVRGTNRKGRNLGKGVGR